MEEKPEDSTTEIEELEDTYRWRRGTTLNIFVIALLLFGVFISSLVTVSFQSHSPDPGELSADGILTLIVVLAGRNG